jgi:hypothetical protein
MINVPNASVSSTANGGAGARPQPSIALFDRLCPTDLLCDRNHSITSSFDDLVGLRVQPRRDG